LKGAADDLVGRVQFHPDLTGIGIDDEGLMLCECEWTEDDAELQNCEQLHCISPGVVSHKFDGTMLVRKGVASGAVRTPLGPFDSVWREERAHLREG